MNYLAIDASTEACSVALCYQGNRYSRYQLCPQSHSLMLLPMVDEVLNEANITLAQLDGLIFGQGPGSFTGVRIGIGVAQGLAYSANLPVVGVSTLQTMAQQAFINKGQTQVISAIDARMAETYCGLFAIDANQIMQPVIKEAVIAPASVNDYITDHRNDDSLHGVGSAWNAYKEQLANIDDISINDDIEFPTAVAMLAIGKAEFALGNSVAAEQAQPVYLRDTVTWKKLPGRE
ncbi:tRNA (adenosine(37)-N6)-threonylcarbamoyltransferase complex dimerization subunit type 1 TsaB [Thalassotalea sp. ND16A]|uniref:tRNA (adenosine(37)-N6)-threonylcarbamoyltransferase complex dimerization subunit type 1 TsaB n=1 Tax=Thalassotalea sp. ND16A TaxID=1535422 RepID=UPI00051A1120|nr:tRNA (adenosine(37)-N6)-threonylcarbamoyltransferase complex dimerization subunit type 1 TsaB [Thalassotalea sp. ND16A]